MNLPAVPPSPGAGCSSPTLGVGLPCSRAGHRSHSVNGLQCVTHTAPGAQCGAWSCPASLEWHTAVWENHKGPLHSLPHTPHRHAHRVTLPQIYTPARTCMQLSLSETAHAHANGQAPVHQNSADVTEAGAYGCHESCAWAWSRPTHPGGRLGSTALSLSGTHSIHTHTPMHVPACVSSAHKCTYMHVSYMWDTRGTDWP